MVDAAARMRQLGDPLLAEHAESALRKLAADLPVDAANPDPTRLVPPPPKAAPETLATLGQALEDRKRVTFDYHTMANDSSTRRSAEPFGLFFLNQHWYLVARTPGEEAAKNYRLNRMRGLQVNPARPGTRDYEIPAAFSLRDHARSKQAWELGATDAITAVVRFRAVTGAFARWLLSFAGDLVPVSPPELVGEYYALVRETLAHHSAAPPPRGPPVSASEQLRRILHLIPALADGESHPIAEVATQAGVDRSVLLKDIESISERFEAPGRFVEGLQIYIESDNVSIVPNHFLRPMRLTRGELCALELGLAMLRAERPAEDHRAIDSARGRLQSVIAKLPGEEMSDDLRAASLPPAGDLGHLRLLREAFHQRRKVRITYRKAAEEKASARVICPYGIVFASGMWYAVARDEGADDVLQYGPDVEVLEPDAIRAELVSRLKAMQGGAA